jgi:hypothetical protein
VLEGQCILKWVLFCFQHFKFQMNDFHIIEISYNFWFVCVQFQYHIHNILGGKNWVTNGTPFLQFQILF